VASLGCALWLWLTLRQPDPADSFPGASMICIGEGAQERKPIAMSIPATMRALQQTTLNGPQDLRLITDAPVPVPDLGEVLIRVTAVGGNFGDLSQARGTLMGGPRPRTWRASRPPFR